MKNLSVVCAIIENEGKILTALRGPQMDMPGYWEFPGGKIETGESAESALIREIHEELNLNIRVLHQLPDHTHTYPHIQINLIPFVCTLTGGTLSLLEHELVQWAHPSEVLKINLAPADIPVLESYLQFRNLK